MGEKLIGPFTIEIKVHVAGDEQGVIGAATYIMGPGKVPTREDFIRAIGTSLKACPEGFRLLSGDEFFNKVIVKEKTGREGRFAVPSSFNYDVEALTAEAGAAYVAPADEDVDEDEMDPDDEDDL